MTKEVYEDHQQETNVCHVNARTRPLFQEMLNTLGDQIKVGKKTLKFGDAVKQVDSEEFESLFNRWVSLCIEKNIMRKTLSSDCTKQLEWAQELSDVERAYLSMEALKEIM